MQLGPLVAQLLVAFLPLIRQLMADVKADGVAEPTDAQVVAKFNADIDKYLAEGAAWKAKHPKVQPPPSQSVNLLEGFHEDE